MPKRSDFMEHVVERLLCIDGAAYLHAHFARRGCFAARIDKAL